MERRLTVACLSVLAVIAARSETANMMAKSRRWVVAGWEEREVTKGRSRGSVSIKPARPAGLQGRTVGATVGLVGVTVHKNRRSSPPKEFILKLDDSSPVRAKLGKTVRIGKHRLEVLGVSDGILRLRDMRTKRILLFRPEER